MNRYLAEAFDIKSGKLYVLVQAFDRIMGWAESLDSTPLPLRCWLRSPRRSEADIRPFNIKGGLGSMVY